MQSVSQIIIIAALASMATADVKLATVGPADLPKYTVNGGMSKFSETESTPRVEGQITSCRIPSNFCYNGLLAQEFFNNPDQFIRSNIDNEANKRKYKQGEAAIDMLPFRQDKAMNIPFTIKAEVEIVTPLRWNNPHDSLCEYNVFKNGLTKVVPLGSMFRSGGGYQDVIPKFNIKGKISGCANKGDCVLQIYCHSVETRTYAIGVDVIITGGSGNELPEQDAKHYNDAFDTAHYDSKFSMYRGQRSMEDVKAAHPQLVCILEIKSYLGNGGLVDGVFKYTKEQSDLRKKLTKSINEEIKTAEKAAIDQNKAKGECFEAELYNVDKTKNPKCKRLYTTTYVTNTDYCGILAKNESELKKLTKYEPKMKTAADIGKTPNDPIGACKEGNTIVQCSKTPYPLGCHIGLESIAA